MIQLGQFLTFWAVVYAVVTVYVALFKKEVGADGTRRAAVRGHVRSTSTAVSIAG